MRRHLLFCALGALLGCRTVSEPSGTAIALFCSTYQGAKTESLTVGEEVAVFAGPEGTEDYFLEAAKFLVGSDGRSLTYGSTVYYPDPKQAVRFLAYFPYHTGTFSVPTDQSTATALKEADLCGAVASTTPVATPVALAFEHLMAKVVVITTNKPTTKITFPNAVASGVIHAATAEFVLEAERKDISTTGNELIVPVQPLSRLVLTVADTVLGVVSKVEYVFDGSVSLEAGKTTTLDLTLHPNTKTATLSGSSVTDWVATTTPGNLTQAVSNVLTIHWAPTAHNRSAEVDQVVLTINEVDYAVSNGVSYDNNTFTVPFASTALRYPYTISKISFCKETELLQSCTDILGAMVYKSGASTIGIKDLANAIKIGDLWWATGNLVATNGVAGAQGEGGCRISAPADGGLYFQFGSLIGYKGGALANSGTGIGMPLLTTNDTYWNGETTWRWANEAMVWPAEMVGNPTSWPTNITNQWYFGLQTDWSTAGQNIRDFPNLATGGLANVGVGDPCTYYLYGTWRLPTTTEQASITGKIGGNWTEWATDGLTGRWATSIEAFGGVSGPGAWFGQGLNAGVGTPTILINVFVPASGFRSSSNGLFSLVTTNGYGWSSAVGNATNGYRLAVHELLGVFPQHSNSRPLGFPVRCVSDVAP